MTIDFDFLSIRILAEDLKLFSAFYSLTDRRLAKTKDPRVDSLILLTSDPFMIFVDAGKELLLEKFRDRGLTCIPSPNPLVLSKVRSRRMDASLITNAILDTGNLHVFLYVYGTKCVDPEIMERVDRACERGGAVDNCFDIGISCRSDKIQVFHVPDRNRQGTRTWNFPYLTSYPLFKHIGKGFGSLEFKAPSQFGGARVKIYQLWVHWIKAALNSNLSVPITKRVARSFREKYRELLVMLRNVSPLSCLGGYRVEVSATARLLGDVLRSCGEICHLDYWMRKGLLTAEIYPQSVLQAVETAFCKAEELRVFSGDGETSENEKIVLIDLLNLIGITTSPKLNSLLRTSGFESDHLETWGRLQFRPARSLPIQNLVGNDFNTMARYLKYRAAIGGGYTLTMAKGGGQWNQRWWIGRGEPDEANINEFLLEMIKMVDTYARSDWKKLFKLSKNPRDINMDFNAQRYRIRLPADQAWQLEVDRRLNEPHPSSRSRVNLDSDLDDSFIQEVPDDGLEFMIDAAQSLDGSVEEIGAGFTTSAHLDHLGEVEDPEEDLERILGAASSSERQGQRPTNYSWVVRPLSASMVEILERVARITYSGRRTEWEPELDICMLEFAYQRKSSGYTCYKPSSEKYWAEACAMGLSRRGADTLRGRWKNKLAVRFESYSRERDSQ